MIILINGDTLNIDLLSAISTNELQTLVCYRDINFTDYSAGRETGLSNGTTANDILSTPSVTDKRIVDFISVSNTDTKSHTVTIAFNDGSSDTRLWRGVLAQDELLTYVEGSGWSVVSSENSKGYTINVQALTSSPTDAQTIYFGTLPKAPVTAAGTSKVYIRKSGRIKIAELYCYSGTAGTAENWSAYIRVNNTTDYLIQTVGVSASERIFTNTALDIPVSAGDYIEIKCINPTWVTNPLTTIFGGYIYIE